VAQLGWKQISAGSKRWMEGMMRMGVMIAMVCRRCVAYIDRGHHPNIMDLVQMLGISIWGCGVTIQQPTLNVLPKGQNNVPQLAHSSLNTLQ